MGEKRSVELDLATPGVDAQGRPVRIPLGVSDGEGGIGGEHLLINIGHKAICRFPLVVCRKVQVDIVASDAPAALRSVTLHNTSGLELKTQS